MEKVKNIIIMAFQNLMVNIYNYKRKGKQYKHGYLIYEGEYLFNKEQNGKRYDENGNIIYELKNGKDKENKDGKLVYKSECLS